MHACAVCTWFIESLTKLTHKRHNLQQHVVLRACQLQNAVNGVKQKMILNSFKILVLFKCNPQNEPVVTVFVRHILSMISKQNGGQKQSITVHFVIIYCFGGKYCLTFISYKPIKSCVAKLVYTNNYYYITLLKGYSKPCNLIGSTGSPFSIVP